MLLHTYSAWTGAPWCRSDRPETMNRWMHREEGPSASPLQPLPRLTAAQLLSFMEVHWALGQQAGSAATIPFILPGSPCGETSQPGVAWLLSRPLPFVLHVSNQVRDMSQKPGTPPHPHPTPVHKGHKNAGESNNCHHVPGKVCNTLSATSLLRWAGPLLLSGDT